MRVHPWLRPRERRGQTLRHRLGRCTVRVRADEHPEGTLDSRHECVSILGYVDVSVEVRRYVIAWDVARFAYEPTSILKGHLTHDTNACPSLVTLT